MKYNAKAYASIVAAVVSVLFLIIGYTSVTSHLTIVEATNACYDMNGNPSVEKDLFGFNWSFSCKED
ncbi:hypothetical protein F9802_10495 [Bacillus aerolatus]|uniref:Uncharacterized protein n=1 Tax=Bacillus aerolatus TaxID=2653354 RepID=A0A6I1FF22_9BACI|nr:hypothetical protein [Bacillus aerolatus]KAB7706617.1 hypothetical protein F9802_10495 [Bacillus aerolatus]